jgi:hypothetical protein
VHESPGRINWIGNGSKLVWNGIRNQTGYMSRNFHKLKNVINYTKGDSCNPLFFQIIIGVSGTLGQCSKDIPVFHGFTINTVQPYFIML